MQLGKLDCFQSYQWDGCKTLHFGTHIRQWVTSKKQNQKPCLQGPPAFHKKPGHNCLRRGLPAIDDQRSILIFGQERLRLLHECQQKTMQESGTCGRYIWRRFNFAKLYAIRSDLEITFTPARTHMPAVRALVPTNMGATKRT
jgi:hypothetical protein